MNCYILQLPPCLGGRNGTLGTRFVHVRCVSFVKVDTTLSLFWFRSSESTIGRAHNKSHLKNVTTDGVSAGATFGKVVHGGVSGCKWVDPLKFRTRSGGKGRVWPQSQRQMIPMSVPLSDLLQADVIAYFKRLVKFGEETSGKETSHRRAAASRDAVLQYYPGLGTV